MLRFTLRNNIDAISIRVEMNGKESMREITALISEYWGRDDVMLMKRYNLLDMDRTIGENLENGDTVDVIPDLTKL